MAALDQAQEARPGNDAVGVGALVGTSLRVFGIARLGAMLFLESIKLTRTPIALPFVSAQGRR